MITRKKQGTGKKRDYTVPALETGLELLEMLFEAQEPLPQKTVASRLGKSVSSTFRLLNSLERNGFVFKDAATGNYALTLKIYGMAKLNSFYNRLVRMASGPMSNLACKVEESCHLSVLDADRIRIIYNQKSTARHSINLRTGETEDILESTSGRLMLAHMDEYVRASILTRNNIYLNMTRTQQKEFFKELKALGEQDYAVNPSHNTPGILDVSLLVVGEWSEHHLTLTLPCIKKWSKQEIEQFLLPAAKETRHEIEKLLGNRHIKA